MAKIFNLSPILAFHLSRLLLIPFFVFIAYLFISLFFAEAIQRKVCLFFLLFSSGLGAYIIGPLSLFDFSARPGFWSPNDIWIPESITFLTLYKSPHFVASLTLMILILLLMFLSFAKVKLRYSLWAGVLALIYFNFHPFYIPMIFGVVGIYLLVLIIKAGKILWLPVANYLILILISLPSIFYHFWLLAKSPVILQRGWQNVTLAPPFVFILVGYGFLWVFAGLGVYFLIKKKSFSNNYIFLVCLLLFSILLVILPFQFQSRYTQGLHLPLVILTVFGLFSLKERIVSDKKFKPYQVFFKDKVSLFFIFLLLFGFSNFFNLFRDFYYFYNQPAAVKNYFYLPKDFINATEWLSSQPANQLVLASVNNSLFIPVFANQKVFAAHVIETLFYKDKLLYTAWFFSKDQADQVRQDWLINQGVSYIFYSDFEKKLGSYKPAEKDYLNLVYQNKTVEIYQVLKE